MDLSYEFETFAIIDRDPESIEVTQEVQGELPDDLHESARFVCCICWATALSLPIWAFIIWLLM